MSNAAEAPAFKPGRSHVTVRDAGRTGWLLGPYEDHHAAIAQVDRGRELACAANSRAWFYAFGTARRSGSPVKTLFGR